MRRWVRRLCWHPLWWWAAGSGTDDSLGAGIIVSPEGAGVIVPRQLPHDSVPTKSHTLHPRFRVSG